MKNFAGVSTIALAAALMASNAFAADASSAPTDVSAVIVTGTRVTGMKAADSAAPIELVGSEALKRTGSADLVQALAQTVPSLNIQTFGFDTAALTVSAALRGLNPNDTLVLVDGKRRHTTSNLAVDGGSPYSGAATTDLSWIPVGAIDHVEVLTDGAAAQYGSDAIAGVVNIILKKNSSGGSASITGGQYYGGDGETGAISLNRGFTLGDKGFVNVTLEQKYHNYSQQGGPDVRYFTPSGALLPGLNPIDAAGAKAALGSPRVNHIIGDPRSNLYNAYFNAGYDLGFAQLYASGNYGQRNAAAYENYRRATRVSGCVSTNYTASTDTCTTPYYPLLKGYSPQETFKESDYALTVGLKGVVSGWDWDLSVAYGKDYSDIYEKDVNPTLFYKLSTLSPTPIAPQTKFYDGSYQNSEFAVTLDIDRTFDVGLASPLNVALGATERRDTYGIGAGEPSSYVYGGANAFSGYLPQDSGTHSRMNYAAYADLAVDPIKGLHTDLAGRFEHFSDFGDSTVGKFTVRYDLNSILAVRSTVSTGFRAPTLAEEYYSGTNVGPTTAFVQLPPNSPQALSAGIPALKPETSHNYSVGFVAHPLDRLQITADVYEIDMHNRILGSGNVVGCYGSTTCSTVESQNVLNAIAARGITIDTSQLTYAGINVFVNGANTRTSGAELTANYASDFGDLGHVDWQVALNYNTTKITKKGILPAALQNVAAGQVNIFNASVESSLKTETPKEKIILGAIWSRGPWTVNVNETIYGETSGALMVPGSYTDPTSNVNATANSRSVYNVKDSTNGITNIDVAYKLSSSIKINIGANNLFDLKPPTLPNLVDNGATVPVDGSHVANAPVQFSPYGINGGYYYGRVTFNF